MLPVSETELKFLPTYNQEGKIPQNDLVTKYVFLSYCNSPILLEISRAVNIERHSYTDLLRSILLYL